MFGWKMTSEPLIGRTAWPLYFDFGVTVGRYEGGPLTVKLHLWRWRWTFFRYGKRNRLTGPAENRSVLSYFFGGAERRTKGRAFRAGFAEAAAKGPVPRREYAIGGTCGGCDDPEC